MGISVGRYNAPEYGSGILVIGARDSGGRLQVSRLETDTMYADSKIPQGTADLITGGRHSMSLSQKLLSSYFKINRYYQWLGLKLSCKMSAIGAVFSLMKRKSQEE